MSIVCLLDPQHHLLFYTEPLHCVAYLAETYTTLGKLVIFRCAKIYLERNITSSQLSLEYNPAYNGK